MNEILKLYLLLLLSSPFIMLIVYSAEEISGFKILEEHEEPISNQEDLLVLHTWNCYVSLLICILSIPSSERENVWLVRRQEKNREFLDVPGKFPAEIAKAGMVASKSGIVKCIYCECEFRNWKEGDDPFECHAALAPQCLYVIFRNSLKRREPSDLNHRELFMKMKLFVQSSKYEVGKEFGYEEELLTALAVTKLIVSKEQYMDAGDLVQDADKATHPDPTALYVAIVTGFHELLIEATKRWDSRSIQTMKSDHKLTAQMQGSSMEVEPDRGLPVERGKDDLKSETERLYYNSRCKKCLKNPATHVVLPCSELSICSSCLQRTQRCPSCSQPIEFTIQTFM